MDLNELHPVAQSDGAKKGRNWFCSVKRRVGVGTLLVALTAGLAACSSGSDAKANAASANQLVTAGLAAEAKGDVNSAEADYKAAEAKDPHNYFAPYDLGYIYQARGSAAQAASEYQKALLINPKFGRALYNLGVLKSTTNPAAAISYYEQDLQVEPSNASANFNLGVLLIKQGQTTQGYADLETGIRLNPALSADIPAGIAPPPATTTTTP